MTQVLRRVYFAVDRMGSIIGVLDGAGNVVERVKYGPYGRPTVVTSTQATVSSVNNVLFFQSHLWDGEAGLYLARARVLNPTTGGFLQRDPSGFADSVNLYAFVGNDAVNFSDPTGSCGPLCVVAYAALLSLPFALESDVNADLATPALAGVSGLVGLGAAGAVGGTALRQVLVSGLAGGGFFGLSGTALSDVQRGQLTPFGIYARNTVIGGVLGTALAGAGYGAFRAVGEVQSFRRGYDFDLEGAFRSFARESGQPSQLAPAAASTPDVALGLSYTSGHATGMLERFAQKVEALPFNQWVRAGLARSNPSFYTRFAEATARTGRIHFNLSGMKGLEGGLKPVPITEMEPGTMQVTEAELTYILKHPELLKKTVFYKNGDPVAAPTLRGAR